MGRGFWKVLLGSTRQCRQLCGRSNPSRHSAVSTALAFLGPTTPVRTVNPLPPPVPSHLRQSFLNLSIVLLTHRLPKVD